MSTAPSLTSELLRFTLEATKGPHAGLRLEFQRSSVTIGRGPENEVVLSEDPRVSRQHVEIKQSLGQFYLVNLSQKNFVLLNGATVNSEKMENKALIQVGETEFRFTAHGATNLLEPVSSNPAPPTPARPAPLRPVPPPGYGMPTAGYPQQPPPPQNWGTAYQPPPPRPVPPPSPLGRLLENKRVRIYGGIALVGLLIFLALPKSTSRRANEKAFRTTEQIDLSRQETENEIKAFRDRKDKMQATVYQKAYENFLRGYRDYRQGQYARAREAFQVVLNLDPENELAHRYYNLAKIRFDEVIKFHMLQGRRYLEKQNYRMCRSNYQTAMTMLGNDPSNAEYKEAKLMHERCSTAMEGHY